MTEPSVKVEMTRDFRGRRCGQVLEVLATDARIGQLLGFLRVVDAKIDAALRGGDPRFICSRGLHNRSV